MNSHYELIIHSRWMFTLKEIPLQGTYVGVKTDIKLDQISLLPRRWRVIPGFMRRSRRSLWSPRYVWILRGVLRNQATRGCTYTGRRLKM
jgi:hypothetical protein